MKTESTWFVIILAIVCVLFIGGITVLTGQMDGQSKPTNQLIERPHRLILEGIHGRKIIDPHGTNEENNNE